MSFWCHDHKLGTTDYICLFQNFIGIKLYGVYDFLKFSLSTVVLRFIHGFSVHHLYYWVIFHYTDIPPFVFLSNCCWTFGLFQFLLFFFFLEKLLRICEWIEHCQTVILSHGSYYISCTSREVFWLLLILLNTCYYHSSNFNHSSAVR